MIAHSYAHLFALPCTGLRFFTVYGPWGRPDMAYWKFTAAILEDLCGRKARRVYKPKPPGDVDATFADVSALTAAVGFEPATPLETGLARFVEWYRAWRGA